MSATGPVPRKWEPEFTDSENGGDGTLESAVQQAVGTASVCWDTLPTGIFDDRTATAVVNGLVAWIEERYAPKAQVRTATTRRQRVQDNPQA